MELKMVKDYENKVLGRREIEFFVMQDSSTPKKDDVRAELCKKLNLSPDTTVVVRIDQEFGTKLCRAVAHSYASRAEMDRFVKPKKEKKEKKPKAAKATEAEKK